MPWLARIEQTRFSKWPQPPSPEPKRQTERAAPIGTKWYVPNGPRFSGSVIVGASGSSARNKFDIPNKRAVNERAIVGADPQIEMREQNRRLNSIRLALLE